MIGDADEPGRRFARCVGSVLAAAGVDTRTVELDAARDDGYDLADFLEDVRSDYVRREARERIDELAVAVEARPAAGRDGHVGGRADDDSQVTRIVELAKDAELFHSPEGEAFATIPIGDHEETWALRATPLKRWLQKRFYDEEGKVPGAQALTDAMAVLEGRALFDGPERVVATRVARTEDALWIDLADDGWQAIRVTANGWTIVPRPPVKFRRAPGMLTLPYRCPVQRRPARPLPAAGQRGGLRGCSSAGSSRPTVPRAPTCSASSTASKAAASRP